MGCLNKRCLIQKKLNTSIQLPQTTIVRTRKIVKEPQRQLARQSITSELCVISYNVCYRLNGLSRTSAFDSALSRALFIIGASHYADEIEMREEGQDGQRS